MIRRVLTTIAIIALVFSYNIYAQQKKEKMEIKKDEIAIKTSRDSLAYAIGVQIGTSLMKDSLIVDLNLLKAGAEDVLNNRALKLSLEEMNAVMASLTQELQEKDRKLKAETAKVAKKASEEFLNANKSKPGIITTQSGLQYRVITMGNGAKPIATSEVTVHYTGKLINGNIFDSSHKSGEPISFPLNGVISGWTEGLQLMPVGSKFEFIIPPHLGYGERGHGPIGANEVLIFEVELLDVK